MANELQTKLDAILNDKNTNLLPENLKAGVTCLGIEGTLKGGEIPVKLFETTEEMQADKTAKEGDLALVYRDEIQNATVNSRFQTARFPSTVVLPQKITDYIDVSYRAVDSNIMFDCWGDLSSTRFSMDCWSETGSVYVQYTSSDGITYTRTDGGEEIIDFGTEIYYAYSEYWNDAIGYFIQCGGQYFDGLYTYKTYTDANSLVFLPINNISFTPAETTFNDITFNGIYDTVEYDISKIGNALHKQFPGRTSSVTIYQDTNNVLHVIPTPSGQYYSCLLLGVYDNTGKFLGLGNTNTTVVTCNQYRIDLETETCILEKEITTIASNHESAYQYLPITDIKSFPVRYSFSSPGNTIVNESYYGFGNYSTFTSYKSLVNTVNHHLDKTAYLISPTQLTLNDAGQLLPGKMAYGKNGIVIGDGSIYDDILSPMQYAEAQTNNNYIYRHRDVKGKSILSYSWSMKSISSIKYQDRYIFIHYGTELHKYDTYTDTSEALPNPPYSVVSCPTCIINDVIYFFGAVADENANNLLTYDIVSQTYTTTPITTPLKLYGGSATYKDGKIYIFGNMVNNRSAEGYVFDMSNNTFTQLPSIPSGYGYNNKALLCDDDIYIFGSGGASPKCVSKYNISSNTMIALPDLPISIYNGDICFCDDGKLYLSGSNSTCYTYDLETGESEFVYNFSISMTSGIIRPDGVLFVMYNNQPQIQILDMWNIIDLDIITQQELIINASKPEIISNDIVENKLILGIRGTYTG